MFFAANVTVTGTDVRVSTAAVKVCQWVKIPHPPDCTGHGALKEHALLAEYASETWQTSCTGKKAIATPLYRAIQMLVAANPVRLHRECDQNC